jgi:uncharacterized membrane protein YeaQ/YmgE (transglycosylase-associated protein family)
MRVADTRPYAVWRTMRAERPQGYLFFGLAAVSLLMFSIDSTVVSVALPNIMSDLQTNLVWVGWTLTGFQLAQTATMPLAGKLSESFGRMRVFLVCVALFTVGSLLCGLAPNIETLIAFRVLQAIGGGGFLPSAAGIVAREFPSNRDRLIGLFSTIFPVGGIIGPNMGGFVVEHWGWREVFLINVPIGLVVLAILVRSARAPEPTTERRVDLPGALLFASAITSLLAALSLLGQDTSHTRVLGTPARRGGAARALRLAGAAHARAGPRPPPRLQEPIPGGQRLQLHLRRVRLRLLHAHPVLRRGAVRHVDGGERRHPHPALGGDDGHISSRELLPHPTRLSTANVGGHGVHRGDDAAVVARLVRGDPARTAHRHICAAVS